MSLSPYPKYKASGIKGLDMIPAAWTEAKLGHLTTKIGSGKTPGGGAETYVDEGVVFLRSQNIYNDGIRLKDVVRIGYAVDQEMSTSRVLSDDILLNITGASLGRTCLVPPGFGAANVNQHVCIIRLRERRSAPFVSYAMQSNFVWDQMQVSQTGAAREGLNFVQVGRIGITLPPLPEQRVIVEYLDRETAEIDAFITDQEELISLLTERRTATITHAVTRGLDPGVPMKASGIEWVGDIPSHWHLRRLWTLFDREKNVGHPDEQMLSVFRDHGVVPKDSMANLNQTAENRNIYQLVTPGWLVSNRMKAWQGSVGISTYRGIVSGHYICFRPKHNEHSPYLNYLFRSRTYTAGYNTISRGVRIGQAEIDNDEYRILPVLLPPLNEQRDIAEYLARETADIDAAIADAREAIALSKERRAAVVSAAVSGKIDVRGAAVRASSTKMGGDSVGVA